MTAYDTSPAFPFHYGWIIVGMGSGASNVPMMGLVSTWFSRNMRGQAAGFIVTGSGFAFILSGKLVPVVNGIFGQEGWRINWLILGTASTIISFICVLLLRNKPEEMGLQPCGCDGTVPNRSSGDGVIQPAQRVFICFDFLLRNRCMEHPFSNDSRC